MTRLNRGQQGFTIIELLIATAVLSTILLMVTAVMISIGGLYYKGISQSRLQNSIRTVSADVSDALKLNEATPQPGGGALGGITVSSYCIDVTRYTYVLDTQIGHQQYYATNPNAPVGPVFRHVLWRDTIKSTGSCLPVDLTSSSPNNSAQLGTNGTELIAPNSRLTEFNISPLTSPYVLSIGEAYGDDDLINHNGINSTCKGNAGDQFCATASLASTAVQRLTDNSL